MQSMQKQQYSEMLDMHMMQNKKMLQSHLANDYDTASRRRQMRSHEERNSNISADRAAINRVRLEQDYIDNIEKKKKQYVQQMYINEKKLYDLAKENERKKQQMELRESQNLIEDSTKKSYDREAQYKSRYKHFNQFQDKVAQSYAKNVLSPEIEKKSKLDSIVKKQVDERNRKIDEMDRYKKTFYNQWNQSTKNVIVNQMTHQRDKAKDEQDKREFERKERYLRQSAIETAEFLEQQQKKTLQSKYKEMLDNQRKIKDGYKAYGNMTDVEKSMNKNDLLAWKNYDYTTYAMIPGFNSANLKLSNKVEQEKMGKVKTRDLDKQVKRLNIYQNTLNKVHNDFSGKDYLPDENDYQTIHNRSLSENRLNQSDMRRSIQSNSDIK